MGYSEVTVGYSTDTVNVQSGNNGPPCGGGGGWSWCWVVEEVVGDGGW